MPEFDLNFPEEPFEEIVARLAEQTDQPADEIRNYIQQQEAEELAAIARDAEREQDIKKWLEAAMRDEEHIHHTLWLYINTPGIHDQIRDGILTSEKAASLASLVISQEVTHRHHGASVGVGEVVVRLAGRFGSPS